MLGAVLVFAGCGSLTVKHVESKSLWIAVTCVFAWVLVQAFTEERLFGWALGRPFGGRLALTVVMVGSLSFSGSALSHWASRDLGSISVLVPWAWGINGCASVIGAVLGKMISMSIGLRMTMVVAAQLYLFSAIVFRFTFRSQGKGS